MAVTLSVARLGVVEYEAALELQDAMASARYRDAIGDTLLILEHPHVFTLGRGADERYLSSAPPDVPVYRVSRGGQVTYHGPGQLVGYPLLKLEGAARDVHVYLRKLEHAMIDALSRCGIAAARRAGLTGVWVGTRKIASIGIALRRWITLHGLAINVCTDLRYFEMITPCGIEGCEMTSIAALGHPEISVASFSDLMQESFAAVFDYKEVREIDGSAIWRSVDRSVAACEARNQ
jgi:lipoate-protein ligase B